MKKEILYITPGESLMKFWMERVVKKIKKQEKINSKKVKL